MTFNTDSAVDVTFTRQARRMQLYRGEILVETGSESPRRRFVVDTRLGQLVALGTQFSVREYERDARVAVLQRAVEARPERGGSSQRVHAGEQARFDASRVDAPSPLQTSALSWRQGELVARGMRVADFVEEIGRYRPGFTLCDDAVADLTISGVFSLDDTDWALRSLADGLPVALNYRTACWVKVVPAR